VVTLEASAWHILKPGREVARFMPYEVTESGARGDLSVPDRNAVPVLSKIALESRECVLEARITELSGPIASIFRARRYLLTCVKDEAGRELHRFPEKQGPLRTLMVVEGARGPWINIRVVRAQSRRVEELVSIVWAFDAEGSLYVLSP